MFYFYFRDTDPSHFPVQFMCNNLNRPNATSYEYLGEMDYKEADRIQMTCRNNVKNNDDNIFEFDV